MAFLRIASIIFCLPFFGDHSVSPQIKILLSFSLAVFFFPMIKNSYGSLESYELLDIVVIVLKEFLLGITIGFTARLVFDGIVMAAHISGFQMGFGSSNLLFPGFETNSHSFTFFHRILVILIFLSLDFHKIYIHAIYESFRLIPLGALSFQTDLADFLIKKTSYIFYISVILGAPILVSLLFSMTALGLIARAVPQLNVFTMSFSISFFLGLTTYLFMMPFLPSWLRDHYIHEGRDILDNFLRLKGP